MNSPRPRPPLDEDSLRELALRYVGRFATSRAKLLSYLQRKLQERGWADESPADPQRLVDRLTELRYVDDGSYALMKSSALTRRGYGPRRVQESLRAAGIEPTDGAEAGMLAVSESWAAAERFARRKRLGPYAIAVPEPKLREKWIASFLRAGHDYDTARRWVDALPGEPPSEDKG